MILINTTKNIFKSKINIYFLLNIKMNTQVIIRTFYNFYNKIQFLIFLIIFNIKLWLKRNTFPYKITIKINNNCNLRCNFCNIWQNTNKEIIKNSLLKKFFNNYAKHIKILSFTGWELFLINDISEKIIDSIKSCPNLNIFSLTTNWFFTKKILITTEHILKQLNNKIFIINISIDWWEKIHNKLRWNKLSYENAMNTYNKLLKLRSKYPNLEVNQEFLLNKENQHILETKVKQKNIIISTIQNSDFYNKDDIIIPNIVINDKTMRKTRGFFNKKFLKWYLKHHYNCYAIQSSLFINWDWYIYPCINWNKVLININNSNIEKEINSWKYDNIKQNIKDKKCPWCWTPCEGYLSIIHEFWK